MEQSKRSCYDEAESFIPRTFTFDELTIMRKR